MNYLRGGFLAWEHLRGPGDTAVFVLAAVLGHVAVMGPLVWIGLVIARRLGVHRSAGVLVAVSIGVGLTAAATLVTYEILRYVGDLANVPLLFGLAGRRVTELLAVSSEHLRRPAAAVAIATATLGVAAWWLHRRDSTPLPDAFGVVRSTTLVALVCLVAGAAHVAARVASETIEFGLARTVTGGVLGQLTQRLSDVDGDGFGWLQRPADPAMWDARVHPYALDWPANGIDEDGLTGDLPSAAPAYREAPPPAGAWAVRPDVLFVMLESVRADAVGARLDGKPVTPAIDAVAAAGVFTRDAWAHNGFTSPARYHVFSGSVAGLRGPTTLIDDFKAQGYEVAYFSGQDEEFGGAEYQVGMRRADRWFHAPDAPAERYTRFTTPGSLAVPFDVLERRVASYLKARTDTRPLMLYVNFHDTHFPYHHEGIAPVLDPTVVPQGSIGPATAAPLRRMYLNTLANVDRAVGRIVAQLKTRSTTDLGVIVTSDHGENLFDDGVLGHGFALGSVQTQVPLAVSGLGIKVQVPFGHADLRDALNVAMQTGARHPALVPRTSAPVLQYVGSLHEPAGIGWVRASGPLVYDFRGDRVRIGAAPWQSPSVLEQRPAAEWRDLIATWERLRLAQAAAASPERR